MRFYNDLIEILTSFVNVPEMLLKNKFLFVFLFGLFFQIALDKLRAFLKLRAKQYPSGQFRAEHIGNRPDDR